MQTQKTRYLVLSQEKKMNNKHKAVTGLAAVGIFAAIVVEPWIGVVCIGVAAAGWWLGKDLDY